MFYKEKGISVLDRQESRLRLNSEAVLRYGDYLEMAEAWLANRYGVTIDSARKAQLGVCIDPFPSHKNWEGRLVLPYVNGKGDPYALKARCIKCIHCEGHPKYLGDADVEPSLYNVGALLGDAQVLYVVEGEMDCIVMAHEMGLNCVGFPGTGSWSSVFTRAIGPDYNRVVVICDGDEPGRLAGKKIAKALRGEVLVLPEGEDVSSLHVKRGKRGLAAVLGLELEPEEAYPF